MSAKFKLFIYIGRTAPKSVALSMLGSVGKAFTKSYVEQLGEDKEALIEENNHMTPGSHINQPSNLIFPALANPSELSHCHTDP